MFYLYSTAIVLNMRIKILLYKTKVLPYIDYCDVIYSGVANTLLTKLQRLKNRGLRICHFKITPICAGAQINVSQEMSLKKRGF